MKSKLIVCLALAFLVLTYGCRHSPTAPSDNGGGNGNGTSKPPEVWTNPDTSMHRLFLYNGQLTHLMVRVITASPEPGALINPTVMLPANGPCPNNSCFSMTAQVCVDDIGDSNFKTYLMGYWSPDGIRPVNYTPDKNYFSSATVYTSRPISSGECVDINREKAVFWPGSRYIIFWAYQGYYLGEEGVIANRGGYYTLDMGYITAGQ